MIKDVNNNEYKKYLYGKYLVSFDIHKLKHVHENNEYSDLNELLLVLDELEKTTQQQGDESKSEHEAKPNSAVINTEISTNTSKTQSESSFTLDFEKEVKKHPQVTLYTVSGRTCFRYKGKTYDNAEELFLKLKNNKRNPLISEKLKNKIIENTDFDDKGLWIALAVVMSIPFAFFGYLKISNSINSEKKQTETLRVKSVINSNFGIKCDKYTIIGSKKMNKVIYEYDDDEKVYFIDDNSFSITNYKFSFNLTKVFRGEVTTYTHELTNEMSNLKVGFIINGVEMLGNDYHRCASLTPYVYESKLRYYEN